MDIGFWGTYARYDTDDKEAATQLLTSNNVIGHPFTIESSYDQGKRTTWIVNPFGQVMGHIKNSIGEQIDVLDAKGWKTVALLASVAFTEEPAPGSYWGEVAIVSYDPEHEEEFSVFVSELSEMLGEGIRPSLNIGQGALREMLAAGGKWRPSGREPLPKLKKGSAYVKTERSSEEQLVDVARRHPTGCSVASIALMILIAAAIVYGLMSCGVFG